jgi:hypothetical protein
MRFLGSSLFGGHDIQDVPAFITRLQSDTDPSTKPVSTFVWSAFDQATQQALTNPNTKLSQRQSALAQALSKILQGNSIFDQTRFSAVTLRPLTKSFMASSPTGDRVIRLNRLLLEDAYPLIISRNSTLDNQLSGNPVKTILDRQANGLP